MKLLWCGICEALFWVGCSVLCPPLLPLTWKVDASTAQELLFVAVGRKQVPVLPGLFGKPQEAQVGLLRCFRKSERTKMCLSSLLSSLLIYSIEKEHVQFCFLLKSLLFLHQAWNVVFTRHFQYSFPFLSPEISSSEGSTNHSASQK